MTTAEYAQKRWSLDDLYPAFDSPELESEKEKLEHLTAEFETQREQPADSAGCSCDERRQAVIILEHRITSLGWGNKPDQGI